MGHYFDYAATSPVCASIGCDVFRTFGNPSSSHAEGAAARRLLEESRRDIAALMCSDPDEVFFTSGATESNCTAVFGACAARARHSKVIVTDDSEHPSVAAPVAQLESRGYTVVRISTRGGRLDTDALRDALSQPVALVSIMAVNNETGAVYDIPAVRREIDRSGCGALLHCDAVQGFLKYGRNGFFTSQCDLMSVSAHKIGGLKGCGALFVRRGGRIPPMLLGGGQEKGFRSGTENTVGIYCFAEAARNFGSSALKGVYEKTLDAVIRAGLSPHIPEAHCYHIISASMPGVRSETLINYLSSVGVYLSASSACSSKKKGNRVLEAFGLTPDEINSAVRISVSPLTGDEDIAALESALLSARERFGK